MQLQLGHWFGDDAYAVEELIAEMCAAFFCAEVLIFGSASAITELVRIAGCDWDKFGTPRPRNARNGQQYTTVKLLTSIGTDSRQ
jgi:Zincin-like metallopeptidase